jgi:hypothetical protein
MKRLFIVALPLLLSACGGGASQYQQECGMKYDKFADVFTCTKGKLASDPRVTDWNPTISHSADNTELLSYGEELNSQVRQQLITDAQAKQLFAQRTAEIKQRHEPAPLPLQPGRY